jgi:hypothetical protein
MARLKDGQTVKLSEQALRTSSISVASKSFKR